MTRSLRYLLPLLAATAVAWADEPKTLDDYKKLVTPSIRKAIDEQIVLLNRWPDREAQLAARALISLGEPVIPDLASELEGGDPRAQVACAHIAGELSAAILFDHLVASARHPQVRAQLPVYFRALAQMDRARAVPAVCRFVAGRDEDARRLAEKFLTGLVSPPDLPLLVTGIAREKGPARAAFIRLAAQLGGDSMRDALLDALADDSPEVAFDAARALGKLGDDATLAALASRASDVQRDRRQRGYAVLGLVHAGRLRGRPAIPPALFPDLTASLLHVDPFARGVAAIALAEAGRHTRDPEVSKALDEVVVPVLIRTMGSEVYFPDFRSVRDLALEELRLVSGEDHGVDFREWAKWWTDNAAEFRAVRALDVVGDAELAKLVVRFVRRDAAHNDQWRFAASRIPALDATPEVRQFVLTAPELKELFEQVRRAGILEAPSIGSDTSNPLMRSVSLELGRQRRTVLVAGEPTAPVAAAEDAFEAWVARLEWQGYRDLDRHAEWDSWYEEQRRFWNDPERDPLDRARRLKSMIIDCLNDLPPPDRKPAAARLAELSAADPELSAVQAEWVLLMAQGYSAYSLSGKGDGFGPEVRDLALVAARSRQPGKIALPMLDFLDTFPDERTQPVREALFEGAGAAIARKFLDEHPDARVRGAAAAALWLHADPALDAPLVALLADKSELVRKSAARALGRRKTAQALPGLVELAEQATGATRREALIAIARIEGERAIPRLAAETKRPEADLDAVAQALAATGHATAVGVLVDLVLSTTDPATRAVLVPSLSEMPRELLASALVPLALDEGRAEPVRATALELLSAVHLGARHAELAPLLSSRSPGLSRAAALLLAYYREPRAIPILVDRLALAPADPELRAALEAASLVRFDVPASELAAAYRAWWEAHGAEGPRAHLVAAIAAGKGSVDGLLAWGKDEAVRLDALGVAALTAALSDGRWYVVRAASLALGAAYGIDRPPPSRYATPARRAENREVWRQVVASTPLPGDSGSGSGR